MPRWAVLCCRLLLIAGVALAVGAYLYVALARLRYPFELEWMEGESLVQVDRIITGQPLYDRPSLAYVPFIYPPLYYYLAAAVSVAGPGFLPLRLVSLVASLGCFALVFLFVWRDTGDTFAATAATGLFAATYRVSGAWFDVGRADTLLLLFLLAGMFLLRRETRLAASGAGVCFALAFLTKQTAWIAFLPPLLYALWRARWQGALFGGAAVAVAGGVSLALAALTHGWYWFYVFVLPSHHTTTTSPSEIMAFWVPGVLTALPIAVLLALCAFVPFRVAAAPDSRQWFYVSMALGFLGLSWGSWLNRGSYDNVLQPACAVLAILAGLGLRRASDAAKVAGAWAPALQAAACLACLAQLALLRYSPAAQIPTEADRQANQRLVDTLRQVQGDVFVPYHNYLGLLAGKRPYAHYTALAELRGDYGGGNRVAEWAAVQQELTQAVRQQRFAAIVLDEAWPKEGLDCCYTRAPLAYPVPGALIPVTGWQTRPADLYLPRRSGQAAR